MDVLQLKNLPFPREVIKLVSNEILRFILGDSYDEVISVKDTEGTKDKEFFVPIANLCRDRTATTKLMWASGYYYASIIGQLFRVTRESQRKFIRKIEQEERRKIERLEWLSMREVQGNQLKYYVSKCITNGKIDCRQVLGRKLINPEGYNLFIIEYEEMLANKVCPICGQKSARRKYCDNKVCKKTAASRRNHYRKCKPLTLEKCPSWAKPILQLQLDHKHYEDADFVFHDVAAAISGLTVTSIFYWIRRQLFTIRKLEYTNSVCQIRTKMAIPLEQIELFRQLNPHIKTRAPVS